MHITCVEIDKFKSFGSYTRIPLLEGFTVISGPNGSGKSNIIDSLLFALGLAGSRGMRAGKLSDLIHQGITRGEAVVTVTFGGTGDQHGDQLVVTRKLRVNGPNYTSTFLLNGQVVNITELHETLARYRIYPQGYNVVLQGDVTDIISMNSRERREIIDEMAGVAAFDRQIALAHKELAETQSHEERLRFVAGELNQSRERLTNERKKAQEYQILRGQLEQLEALVQRLLLIQLRGRVAQATLALTQTEAAMAQDQLLIATYHTQIQAQEQQLSHAQQQVKQLGEQEQLSLQGVLTRAQLEYEQTIQQQQAHGEQIQRQTQTLAQIQIEVAHLIEQRVQLAQQQQDLEQNLAQTRQQLREAQQRLAHKQEELRLLSASSEAGLRQQTGLTHRIQELQTLLGPLRQTLTRLGERRQQQQRQQQEQAQEIEQLSRALAEQEPLLTEHTQALVNQQQDWETLKTQLKQIQGQFLTEKSTLRRLEKEQQVLQRELDQLEARQAASREIQGQGAVQRILRANLEGVHGPVIQLAQVEPEYQLALEVAAGGRLFNLVVEDDEVAARAIELLKRERAGRATFLPLNKLDAPRRLEPLREEGSIAYAVDLLDFDPLYARVFSYVLGETVIYSTIDLARRQLRRQRMVTLTGELLEKTGAMTGGSVQTRSQGQWGQPEAELPREQQQRLQDLEAMITALTRKLDRQEAQIQTLQEATQAAERQVIFATGQQEQRQKEVTRLGARYGQVQKQYRYLHDQSQQDQQAHQQAQAQLGPLEAELSQAQEELAQLETQSLYQQWQDLQRTVQGLESQRQQLQNQVYQQEAQIQKLEANTQLSQQREADHVRQQHQGAEQIRQLESLLIQLEAQKKIQKNQLQQIQDQWQMLEVTLASAKTQRDQWETQVNQTRRALQEAQWQGEQHQRECAAQTTQLAELQQQYLAQDELCGSLGAESPPELTLEQAQAQIHRIQRRISTLEPVNMLAIDEYTQVEGRLAALTERVDTLAHERTELLLRIETLATLKQEAFLIAFRAVNDRFEEIFHQLSDGDGHLQLEYPEDPFSGGLNLVAHPKGKNVRRLESMSGGEKSLTALSFIFALQRYRPSPFYAFDEVDMFLDGANVERLAQMIEQSAKTAQFLVVSLRRPMIERADRTIGVTLGHNERTQVLGLKKGIAMIHAN